MEYALDIFFLVVAAVVIAVAAKKGFAATLVDTFSMVISAFAAYKASPIVAQYAYDSFIKGIFEARFSKALNEVSSSVAVTEKINAMLETIPKSFINFAEAVGVNVDSTISSIASSASTNEQLVEAAVEKFAQNVVVTITQGLVFLIIFIVASILLSLLSKLFKRINDIPVVGTMNIVLGGVLGAVNAVVVIFVACSIMYLIVKMSADNSQLVQEIEASKIYNIVTEYNPIVKLFRGV